MRSLTKTTIGSLLILSLFIGLQSAFALAADEVTEQQIQQAQADLGQLYKQLLGFKDKAVFHTRGFEEEDPESYQWLANVTALQNMMNDSNGYPERIQNGPEILKDLADEYKDNAGNETETTKKLCGKLERALK